MTKTKTKEIKVEKKLTIDESASMLLAIFRDHNFNKHYNKPYDELAKCATDLLIAVNTTAPRIVSRYAADKKYADYMTSLTALLRDRSVAEIEQMVEKITPSLRHSYSRFQFGNYKAIKAAGLDLEILWEFYGSFRGVIVAVHVISDEHVIIEAVVNSVHSNDRKFYHSKNWSRVWHSVEAAMCFGMFGLGMIEATAAMLSEKVNRRW